MRSSERKSWYDVAKLEACRELGTPFRREELTPQAELIWEDVKP
jgi:hypothetical protein